jgi:hypothetical protein
MHVERSLLVIGRMAAAGAILSASAAATGTTPEPTEALLLQRIHPTLQYSIAGESLRIDFAREVAGGMPPVHCATLSDDKTSELLLAIARIAPWRKRSDTAPQMNDWLSVTVVDYSSSLGPRGELVESRKVYAWRVQGASREPAFVELRTRLKGWLPAQCFTPRPPAPPPTPPPPGSWSRLAAFAGGALRPVERLDAAAFGMLKGRHWLCVLVGIVFALLVIANGMLLLMGSGDAAGAPFYFRGAFALLPFVAWYALLLVARAGGGTGFPMLLHAVSLIVGFVQVLAIALMLTFVNSWAETVEGARERHFFYSVTPYWTSTLSAAQTAEKAGRFCIYLGVILLVNSIV